MYEQGGLLNGKAGNLHIESDQNNQEHVPGSDHCDGLGGYGPGFICFVVWPLLNVVKQSFTDLDGNFSIQAYINIVTMSETYQALVNTLMLAIIVGVLATSVGFLFAYCSSHLAIKGKKLFNLMALLPMVSPPFSVALSIIMLFGSRGLVTYSLLGWSNTNIYGLKGLIFVQTISYFPIAFLLLAGMLLEKTILLRIP